MHHLRSVITMDSQLKRTTMFAVCDRDMIG
jgi:hypothetical protein